MVRYNVNYPRANQKKFWDAKPQTRLPLAERVAGLHDAPQFLAAIPATRVPGTFVADDRNGHIEEVHA